MLNTIEEKAGAPKEIPFTGATEVHYFEREENNETVFFTMLVSKVTQLVLRSAYRTPGVDDGKHIDECITHYKKEGYTHHRI